MKTKEEMQRIYITLAYEAWCLGDKTFEPLFGPTDPVKPRAHDPMKPDTKMPEPPSPGSPGTENPGT